MILNSIYFHLNQAARRNDDDYIEYMIQYRDGWHNRIVSSAEAAAKWPKLLVEFLEENIKMAGNITTNATQNNHVSFVTEVETTGEPIRVTCKYCCLLNIYSYLFESIEIMLSS